MYLSRVNCPGIATAQGVHFPMMNDAISVRVVVSGELIRTISGAVSAPDLTTGFEAYRREFEAIASAKFARGERGPLRINASDILQFAAEQMATR
jgi:hypothetical protein